MVTIDNFLLKDPTEIDIVRNLPTTRSMSHVKMREICDETVALFGKYFGTHLISQPREMQRYSEHPEEFSPIKNFRMHLYAAIAIFYLEQLKEYDDSRSSREAGVLQTASQ